jgi:hypothetical protein
MSGMEGLGRVFNVISLADTVGFSMSECSAVSLVFTASGASSALFAAAKTFAGSYDAFLPASGFGQPTRWYQSAGDTGTTAWTKQTAVWTNGATASLALAGTTAYMSVVSVFGSQMADGYKYLKVTCTNATVVAITHDLTVQRTPANLAKLGA